MPTLAGRPLSRKAPAALAACLLAATPAGAVEDPDPDFSLKETVAVGPFHLAPFFVIKDLGYDSNTRLNSRQDSGDYTLTVGPGARAVAPLGHRAAIALWDEVDYAMFATQTDLNHVNNSLRAKLHFYLRDVTPYLDGEQSWVRERPDNQIDFRIRTTTTVTKLGAIWRPSGRGKTDIHLRRADYRYESGDPQLASGVELDQAEEIGEQLARNLERVETAVVASNSIKFRPRTSLLLDVATGRIDFDDPAPQRDSSAVGAMAGFEFDPAGSLRGRIKAGFKHLSPDDDRVDGYSGLIADVDLRARLLGRGEARAEYERNTRFSIYGDNLFYLDDRVAVAYEHYFSSRLSVELGRQLEDIDYPIPIQLRSDTDPICSQAPPGALPAVCTARDRHDDIVQGWMGVRYRLGPEMRVGLRFAHWDRDSTFDDQDAVRNTYTMLLEYTP